MSIDLNQFAASIIIGTFVLYNSLALPKLVRVLYFYAKNNWDFQIDSPAKIPLQEGFRQKFSSMPIGIVKIRVLVTQVIMALLPVFMALRSYYRH